MERKMKIGIFDSGLGGLIIARAIRKLMPEYDYVYLGDTKRVPYGPRSHDAVFEFTKQSVQYLFETENCALVIVACNTSSSRALRRIQQEYLPNLTPSPSPYKGEGSFKRNVIGVLIPTAEECAKYGRVGIIGTLGTIASNTFSLEINKINNKVKIFQNPAPMLVPLAEAGEKVLAKPFLEKYLKPFAGKKIEALALGCTHYPFYKSEIRKILSPKIKVLSQDEIVPKKLKEYLGRHQEIEKQLSKNRKAKLLVTDITKNIQDLSKKMVR